MIKKITKRYNRKLSHEFRKMKIIKEEFNMSLSYQSGVNSVPSLTKEQAKSLAISFDNNENEWKKYIKKVSVTCIP